MATTGGAVATGFGAPSAALTLISVFCDGFCTVAPAGGTGDGRTAGNGRGGGTVVTATRADGADSGGSATGGGATCALIGWLCGSRSGRLVGRSSGMR